MGTAAPVAPLEEAAYGSTSWRALRHPGICGGVCRVPGLVHRTAAPCRGADAKLPNRERHRRRLRRVCKPVSLRCKREFRGVSWSSGDTLGGGGFSFGNLNVSRGGPTNHPQTFLFYFVEQCDVFFNCTFFGGSGLIPNTDLSGGGKTLRLSTNTTGNPDFFTFAGPTGLISVDWKANGFFQQRQSGTFEQDFPGSRFLSNGVSTFASANATGSVIGVSISGDNFASIGTNTNVSINIFR